MELKGQWIGKMYDGTNEGLITLNIDSDTPNSGVVLAHDEDTNKASTISDIKLEIAGNNVKGTLSNFSFHPHAWHNQSDYPLWQESIPNAATLTGEINDDQTITGDWITDIGTGGSLHFNLPRTLENFRSFPRINN